MAEPAFKSKSGQYFDTESLADAHDKLVDVMSELADYEKDMRDSGVHETAVKSRSTCAKHFLRWKVSGQIEVPVTRKKAAVPE